MGERPDPNAQVKPNAEVAHSGESRLLMGRDEFITYGALAAIFIGSKLGADAISRWTDADSQRRDAASGNAELQDPGSSEQVNRFIDSELKRGTGIDSSLRELGKELKAAGATPEQTKSSLELYGGRAKEIFAEQVDKETAEILESLNEN